MDGKTLRKMSILLVAVVLTAAGIVTPRVWQSGQAHAATYAEGSGTILDPYLIGNAEELHRVRDDLDAYYLLADDIDLSVFSNWEPIGSQSNRFMGVIDGNGHTITGLTINRPEMNRVGLISEMGSTGRVSNLVLDDVNVAGREYVGGLVGVTLGIIENVHVSGEVTGNGKVGGLAGWNLSPVMYQYTPAIRGSSMNGNVTGFDMGILGMSDVGGLVAKNDGVLERSYASGIVTGDSYYVGGVVGSNGYTIENNYSTAKVDGYQNVGGLVGYNMIVGKSYAIGEVNGVGMYVGGLVGYQFTSSGTTSSFYNKEIVQTGDAGKGDPKTTVEMQTLSTYTGAGWDFDNIWTMEEGEYPTLRPFQTGYSVTYVGNGNWYGAVPTDTAKYSVGDPVTVMGNSGGLTRGDGKSFGGWNTNQDGSGQSFMPGDSFDMGVADLKLYAQWIDPTYTIEALDDLVLEALTAGYASGSQETKTVTVARTGTGDLANLSASLSGADEDAFVIAGPVDTALNDGTPDTAFTVRAADGLPARTYTATVTVSADLMSDVTFTVEQTVNPAASAAIKGDGNGDGLVTPADALMVTQYMTGKITLTAEQISALDMNGDNVLDNTDVQMIMMIYLGGL